MKHLHTAERKSLSIDRYFKHVSVICYKGRVVAVGTNKLKSDPKAKAYRFSNPHSELDAYHRVPYNLRSKKLELFNFRFNNKSELRHSKPCELCMPWCEKVFHKIYYT